MTLFQVSIPIDSQINNLSTTFGFSLITDIGSYTTSIVSLTLIIASLAMMLYFAWGGIQYLMSGSDKNKTEEARSRITNAIIGLTIVASTWAIFLILNQFFGLGLVGSGGSGGSGGNLPPPPPPPIDIIGNSACTCFNGGCSQTGDIAPISLGGDCYTCTSSGWTYTTPQPASCAPISCVSCP